jgi:hypothetical protein
MQAMMPQQQPQQGEPPSGQQQPQQMQAAQLAPMLQPQQ